ncbi:hypothetical protein AMATHDRAFT_55341 [Amanita thiersii Skay4041]|uniref:Uncharacterized protein n=1 Tax=Amanita thiersii Skay4041 TaxID=703135 RepID=A0A2A9NY67_9AGAR|nr:hypothetical protein AMATHDRAFT_55341 [Amanita thiersii Skay4041]
MLSSLSLLLLSTLSLSQFVVANSACVAFDVHWNLLAFGFNGKDYDASTQDTWGSGQSSDITTSGRPPFDGPNTKCYLSQFTNSIYILGADSANPAAIHIYDASAKSWSTQAVNKGDIFDPASFDAILDHDTNVFYAYSKGELFSLDMEQLKAASPTTKAWNDVQKANLGDNYDPVMALAQNHVHFLNVPGLPDGSAKIFVIHFSYMQPEPQSYGKFPNTHGQATSFFQESGVQQEFAFIPDDGSATYVINVETNTTQTLKGPSTKDPLATYFASKTALVQLSSSGSVSYLAYDQNALSTNTNAAWIAVNKLPSAGSSHSATPNSTASAGQGAASTGASNTSTGKPASSTSSSSGAITSITVVGWGVWNLFALVLILPLVSLF